MRYERKIVSGILVFCLLITSLHINSISVSAVKHARTKIQLRINDQNVSGKTVSIKKGNKKKIKVIGFKNKKARISFHSNNRSVAAVSKKGKITAKRMGTAKITVTAKIKKKKFKDWIKVKVVDEKRKNDASSQATSPASSPTVMPTNLPTPEPTEPVAAPTEVPSVTPAEEPSAASTEMPSAVPVETPPVSPDILPLESPVPDTDTASDMYKITLRINGKDFPAKLYQTETTKSIMQKLPLSITMDELNGNEKFYYFSERFPTETERVSTIHAGDLKLYGFSCLVLFYQSFSTSYSYTSLGYVENPEGLAEALGTGGIHVDVFVSE